MAKEQITYGGSEGYEPFAQRGAVTASHDIKAGAAQKGSTGCSHHHYVWKLAVNG